LTIDRAKFKSRLSLSLRRLATDADVLEVMPRMAQVWAQ
jgi:hypothetical protein